MARRSGAPRRHRHGRGDSGAELGRARARPAPARRDGRTPRAPRCAWETAGGQRGLIDAVSAASAEIVADRGDHVHPARRARPLAATAGQGDRDKSSASPRPGVRCWWQHGYGYEAIWGIEATGSIPSWMELIVSPPFGVEDYEVSSSRACVRSTTARVHRNCGESGIASHRTVARAPRCRSCPSRDGSGRKRSEDVAPARRGIMLDATVIGR